MCSKNRVIHYQNKELEECGFGCCVCKICCSIASRAGSDFDEGASLEVTANLDEVTCRRCFRTSAFIEAEIEQGIQQRKQERELEWRYQNWAAHLCY